MTEFRCCYLSLASKIPGITLSTFEMKTILLDHNDMPSHTLYDGCCLRKTKNKKISVGEDVEKWESLCTAGRMQNDTVTGKHCAGS